MTAPTVHRTDTSHDEPLLSVFAVRAELEPFADVSHFDREIDAAIEHAAATGSFDRLRSALRTWLGIAVQASNAHRLTGLDMHGRGELQARLVAEWVAEHPEAVH